MHIINPYRYAAAPSASLLLDEANLGSAYGAYSIARKLRSAYSGSAIRVRRTSDSTEQDIGFSANVLNESSLATFCSGTNGYVVTIYDQSGNGRNATQATPASQSQIVASGTVQKDNGKPAMTAPAAANAYTYTGGAVSAISTISMAGVWNTDAGAGISNLKFGMGFGATAGNYASVIMGYGTFSVSADENKPALYLRGSVPAIAAAANVSQSVFCGFINGVNLSFYVNGDSELTATAGTPLAANNDYIRLGAHINGSFYLSNGYWQEGVVWATDKEAYAATIKSNVNGFYGIY